MSAIYGGGGTSREREREKKITIADVHFDTDFNFSSREKRKRKQISLIDYVRAEISSGENEIEIWNAKSKKMVKVTFLFTRYNGINLNNSRTDFFFDEI